MTSQERHNSLKRILLFLLLLGLASLMLATQVYKVRASDKKILGRWGFSASGTIVPPAVPSPLPLVAVGVLTFHAGGSCSIVDTTNVNGSSSSNTTTSCTFTINADGTGTVSAVFPSGPAPLSFVIVDDGDEIRFIRTDLGVVSGVAKPQDD